MQGVTGEDIVLIGFPDTLWEPQDGYQMLVRDVQEGCDVALGLFRIAATDIARSDVVVFAKHNRIAGIDVKPAKPRSEWVWGCAAARARTWAGLHRADWPGGYIDLLCREGRIVRGVKLSDVWLDVGTKDALQLARSDSGPTATPLFRA
jgi:dTDP-glucose pyrophosphorylase